MEINNKEKVYLRNISIEICTDCNLNCSHCYLGDKKEKTIIKPEFIDALIANTSGIDELTLLGGEITLHPEVVEMVLTKFANSGLKINYINFVTNAKIKSEKIVELFNWFRTEHTTNPNDAIFKISSDKFHTSCSPYFTEKQLQENIEWYKMKCDNLVQANKTADAIKTLVLEGNAEQLTKNDLKEFKKVIFRNMKKCRGYKSKCEKECTRQLCEKHTINNCIQIIELHADGYLYNGFIAISLENRKKTNSTFAIGHILDDSILNMVKKYNQECDKCNVPCSIPVKYDSFNFFLIEWEYFLYSYVVEVFNFTIQEKHSFYELKRFKEIDDDMTKRTETIRKYADIYSNEEIKNCLKNNFIIEDFDVAKLKKQIESLMFFAYKTQQFKEGKISKSNYRLWFYHFLNDYIKPQNEDEQKVFDLSKALYEWDLKEYVRIYDILKTN